MLTAEGILLLEAAHTAAAAAQADGVLVDTDVVRAACAPQRHRAGCGAQRMRVSIHHMRVPIWPIRRAGSWGYLAGS